MPASEAQIRANQKNSLKSTGPKTVEGKEASRANSYKHGLTATKLLPEREAAEVDRRCAAFVTELAPSGDVGVELAHLAATMSVRAERCVEHENAMLTERVRQAEAEFLPPEGVDEAEAARLRAEAGKRALFDPSKEATLARKYEAAAQRCFFRALKELHAIERQKKATSLQELQAELASIGTDAMSDEEFDAVEARLDAMTHLPPLRNRERSDFRANAGRVDVPFLIGKPR